MSERAFSSRLRKHLLRNKAKDTLRHLGISPKLVQYIRNLQEKYHGNGVFDDATHQAVLKPTKAATLRKINEYINNGQLVLCKDIHFSFTSTPKKMNLVIPQKLSIATPSDNAISALVMTVTHQDDDQKNWTHDVFALVCKRTIYYFDFNEFGYYMKQMRDFLTEKFPDYTFYPVFSLQKLFPETECTGHIAIQDGTSL